MDLAHVDKQVTCANSHKKITCLFYTKKSQWNLCGSHFRKVSLVFFAGDWCMLVLCVEQGGKLQVFDVDQGTLVADIEAHSGALWSLCSSPDKVRNVKYNTNFGTVARLNGEFIHAVIPKNKKKSISLVGLHEISLFFFLLFFVMT